MTGKVWLVGAGPGDWGLFTLKGREVLQSADVVVYDALIGDEVLTLIPEGAEKIDVGKRAGNHRMPQDRINRVLLDRAQAGLRVVRLKGGDPFVFGRGGEELELLAENGIPFEIVPGVTSAFAVPAYNGIPVTHREFTSSVHVITGHRRAGQEESGPAIDYETLVRTGGTLIFLMGLSSLPSIMQGLLGAGMDPSTPAAVLEKGTTADQRRVVATVSTLEAEAARAGIQAPAIIVVGAVCSLAESFTWAEKRPLAGKKILLTRPKDLIAEMAARLRGLGAEVLELPAIETVPVEPNPALDACIESFGGKAAPAPEAGTDAAGVLSTLSGPAPDWLVFTSPTGVRVFLDRFLEKKDIRALGGVKIAAIGRGSARKLRQYGLRADLIPSVYDGRTLGRELADRIRQERESGRGCPILTEGAGSETDVDKPGRPTRILIPRAAAGNRDLIEELNKAGGVEILDVSTYNTQYTRQHLIDLRKRIREGDIDLAVFTSASTVRGFCAMTGRADTDPAPAGPAGEDAGSRRTDTAPAPAGPAGEDAGSRRADTAPDLTGLTAVCIGRQTAEAAEAAGMRVRTAGQAATDALIDAVLEAAQGDRDLC